MRIAMTGASGNMGREALKQTLELKEVSLIRVLLTDKKKNDKLSKQLKKEYGDRIDIVRGSVADDKVCDKLVKDVDYVVHMAAVIPPASDRSPKDSYECNYLGAVTLTDAIKRCEVQPKYIHISTMALYGNRNYKHPFGRVGDPLLVSPFDHYAMHKLRGERHVLCAGLKKWVVLRQTAMLHPNMLHDNISDGLMFHTALNAPLEWVSSRDSGYLIKRILERDNKGEVDSFWYNVYNIGAGKKGMDTGYDTFKDGFSIIGGSPEKYFKPNYFATRNFHGVWFYDGNELEDLFSFQRDGVTEFWHEIGKAHPMYAAAKIVPAKLVYLIVFKKLLFHPNSPYKWKKDGDIPRSFASFGSEEVASRWEDFKLLAKGAFGDYDKMRDKDGAVLLSHGYDESKDIDDLTVEELRQAARFRGGELVSTERGGKFDKLVWRCSEGHEFEASPFLVLRAGHWCDKCMPNPWNFDKLSKTSEYYAQAWYDSHDKEENKIYDLDKDGKSVMNTLEKQE